MGAENREMGKMVERKEQDSTAEESDALSRYLDLKAAAYKPYMSKEERKDFAQSLIDLVKLLNAGDKIDPVVREDLLRQIQLIDKHYLLIRKFAEAVRRLERESAGGVQVPHVYEKAVQIMHEASVEGVPESALRPFEDAIREYIGLVRAQSRGQ